jgi:hypothetical protein
MVFFITPYVILGFLAHIYRKLILQDSSAFGYPEACQITNSRPQCADAGLSKHANVEQSNLGALFWPPKSDALSIRFIVFGEESGEDILLTSLLFVADIIIIIIYGRIHVLLRQHH